jgi:phage terminase large subunit-like protein
VAGSWIPDFLEEMENFPAGRYKDQVDAASGAFARLTQGPQYSLYSEWLD